MNQNKQAAIIVECTDDEKDCKYKDFEMEVKFKRRIASAKNGVDFIEEQILQHVIGSQSF